MMNLKNMFNGLKSDLIGKKFIEFWEHDEGSLKLWRASSNFVYVFKKNQQRFFLRFSFERDNSIEQIRAELDFMQHLVRHGYPCVVPIPSENGRLVETVRTNDGLYVGVVFSQARGSCLDIETMTDKQYEQWGISLATLHSFAKTYASDDVKRKSWQNILESVETILQRYPLEKEAKNELYKISSWLHSLNISNDNFGLVHYDFQLDNVFWDENKHEFNVIDFDDSMYHWFAMDIVTSLKDLFQSKEPNKDKKIQSFLRGYRSILPLDDEMVRLFPKFYRFDQLYVFTRLLLSIENSGIDNAPEWYGGLKIKLKRVIDETRLRFQTPW
ncbi:phosphotransferase [Brevibacillus centrosporus]|uniref:phosphotransferase enzyme family protein n=1 Tax=Brevibacillus centrosporus TaxID=54910 RepID=UPI002E24A8AE|nr:phosphotransferase [Brevibacillus centrosporus]